MDIASALSEWFRSSSRDLPWRRGGFSAWGTLVSEVMLQQTPAARVIGPLEEWLRRWPAPADLAAASAGDAVRAWGRLGYPRRAIRLHACATAITQEHGGVVPSSIEQLLELPGIGEYTARAVTVFAYGQRHPVVDTNVRRVLARAIGGQAEPGPPSTRRDLAAMVDILPELPSDAVVTNAAVMELGAIVCTARAPLCDQCPIAEICAWRAAGYPAYEGTKRPVQKKYEGSDRQVRGLILHELRTAPASVTEVDIIVLWPYAAQRDRALASLLADGLVTGSPTSGYALPG